MPGRYAVAFRRLDSESVESELLAARAEIRKQMRALWMVREAGGALTQT